MKPEPKPSASWWRTYDRAAMRGDYDRMVQLLAMTAAQKAAFKA